MRGKLCLANSGNANSGLIPAHAGKTVCSSLALSCLPAHPRACGENCSGCRPRSGREGSSPRMRGKRFPMSSVPPLDRLIPAHAGKTPPPPGSSIPVAAHPRACGENRSMTIVIRPPAGSSPRMRGKLTAKSLTPFQSGLIPAHAGKTGPLPLSRHSDQAHPRACGENSQTKSLVGSPFGSSPRMRGKLESACA